MSDVILHCHFHFLCSCCKIKKL